MARSYLGNHPNPAERWEQFVFNPPPLIAFDTETISLRDRTLLGVGASIGTESFYVTTDDEWFHYFLRLLQDQSIDKIYHNCMFDLRVLRKYKVDYINIEDTAVMCHILGIPAVLEEAALLHTDTVVESAKSFLARLGCKDMSQAPVEEVAHKCQIDAEATWKLYQALKYKVPQGYYQVERQIIPMLETISQKGIKIDQQRHKELSEWYTREYSYYKSLADGMGFNPGSTQQVGYILARRKNFLPLTRSRKSISTDKSVLKKLQDPVAQLVLLYRQTQTIRSNFLIPLNGLSRAYTTLHMDAITGRISSTDAGDSEPDRNLQNIPRKADMPGAPPVRSMFVPDGKYLTKMDANQIELRVLAHLSNDSHMKSVYLVPDGDIHSETSRGLGIPRDAAKTFNFAMIYGAEVYTLSDRTGIADLKQVAAYRRLWMETYPEAARWMIIQQEEGLRNGYIETLMGRKMMLPVELGEKHCRNCAVNWPVQGTAAEIFKLVMLECRSMIDAIRLQIHDELLDEGDQELPSGLADVSSVHVPMQVDYKVERWY